MDQSFTLRAIAAGLLIGILINLSNTYYGLQNGISNQMPMVTALLAYLSFQALQKYTGNPFTATENVLVISVATSTSVMPVTAGFIKIILGPEENGPIRLHWLKLILWLIGLKLLWSNLCFSPPEHFIVREKFPWPGPTAAAHFVEDFASRIRTVASRGRRYK